MAFVKYTTTATEEGTRRVTTAWRYVNRQPNWIARAALTVFLLVIALPIFMLLMIAIVVAVLLFGTLAILNAIFASARGLFAKDDGRQNVRVIERSDQATKRPSD